VKLQTTSESKPELNVNSTAFTLKKAVGGFGNKQASQAFASTKIIYRDILAHCTNVSVQEYQKKMKMFQKKVTKKKQFESVQQPEVNYMNIYTQGVKRLSCFENITTKDEELDYEDETYQEGGYFYGDATAYEL
jgi:hypothetical protein